MPVGGREVLLRRAGQQRRIRHRIERVVVDHAWVVHRQPVPAATEEESPSRDGHTGTACKCAHRRGSFQNVRLTRRTYRRTGGCVKKSSRLYSATAFETTSGSKPWYLVHNARFWPASVIVAVVACSMRAHRRGSVQLPESSRRRTTVEPGLHAPCTAVNTH